MIVSDYATQGYLGEIFSEGGLSYDSRMELCEAGGAYDPQDYNPDDQVLAEQILQIAEIADRSRDIDLQMSESVLPGQLRAAMIQTNQDITAINALRGTPLARCERILSLAAKVQYVQKYISFTDRQNSALDEISTQIEIGALAPVIDKLANRLSILTQVKAEAQSKGAFRVCAQITELTNRVIALRYAFVDLVETKVRATYTRVVEHPEDGLGTLKMRGLISQIQDLREEQRLSFYSAMLDLDLFSACFEKVKIELLDRHSDQGQLIGRVMAWSEKISE